MGLVKRKMSKLQGQAIRPVLIFSAPCYYYRIRQPSKLLCLDDFLTVVRSVVELTMRQLPKPSKIRIAKRTASPAPGAPFETARTSMAYQSADSDRRNSRC